MSWILWFQLTVQIFADTGGLLGSRQGAPQAVLQSYATREACLSALVAMQERLPLTGPDTATSYQTVSGTFWCAVGAR